jgi:hypothetical protein
MEQLKLFCLSLMNNMTADFLKKEPTNNYEKKGRVLTNLLLKRYKHKTMVDSSNNVTFTRNKGEFISICIRDPKTMKIYSDINMFV